MNQRDKVIGYLSNGQVLCEDCFNSQNNPGVSLWESNILPYTQDCFTCPKVLVLGSIKVILFDWK